MENDDMFDSDFERALSENPFGNTPSRRDIFEKSVNKDNYDVFEKKSKKDVFEKETKDSDLHIIKRKARGDNEISLIDKENEFCVCHKRGAKKTEYTYKHRQWAENKFDRIDSIFLD